MDLNHPGPRTIRRPRFCCRRGVGGGAKILRLGLLKKEIPLNRIVGSTNQNVWVPLDLGPTRICHESTWVPPKHIVGPV
jgi:hypothetical protein